MKIIGLAANGDYIAIVGHSELEKSANKYYGKLEKLRVGEEFDLGKGYNFTGDIKSACSNMTDAYKAFERSRATLQSFAVMVAALPEPSQDTSEGGAA